ncbi:uncharacterized protein BO88DRAFT_152542 [Aspergillus vadensis CBS 113365]|uniref:Uncharacterized protein n=1 Tax=Aspergillus vadensis (strain CBS 113365 / IMI 142717 / IBT 24658) TaxID=1448311 RepID=A0A319AWN3_ASPVC|nr:hypothetical protein BO88DRAFT_152542 [Aspergillus vadensis CBS 113365]PYH64766.1 hypothetical protein BO88DRAFT_152542 [Aspergillus vadensis CBS 113365]
MCPLKWNIHAHGKSRHIFFCFLRIFLFQSWEVSKISGVRACFTGQCLSALDACFEIRRAEILSTTIECSSGLFAFNTVVLFTLLVSMFSTNETRKPKKDKQLLSLLPTFPTFFTQTQPNGPSPDGGGDARTATRT